jgi:phosphatidylglycerol---prolipoprotein diacylglyceryl transferase
MPLLPLAALAPILALISVTPDPIAFQLGPVPVYWYGVCYAVGLAATYVVITREARRRGLDARIVDNGIIIVGIAALVGGRLYHVIDQWQLYKDDPMKIVLPPYTGLGVYGGILTGLIAVVVITRLWKQPFWRWADVIAPGVFVMQAIGRWGNFFNQELYGPPTDLPWGITIDCAHRVALYPCTLYPEATTGFQPLFLYESISGALGAVTLLWIARRYGRKMRPGDLILIFFIWYAAVRFALETLRTGNWTFFGIPTAMLVSLLVIALALAVLAFRHRPGAAGAERWGDPPNRDEDGEDGSVEDEKTHAGDDDADTESTDGTDGGSGGWPGADHGNGGDPGDGAVPDGGDAPGGGDPPGPGTGDASEPGSDDERA